MRRLITADVEPIHTLVGHTGPVYSVALPPPRYASRMRDLSYLFNLDLHTFFNPFVYWLILFSLFTDSSAFLQKDKSFPRVRTATCACGSCPTPPSPTPTPNEVPPSPPIGPFCFLININKYNPCDVQGRPSISGGGVEGPHGRHLGCGPPPDPLLVLTASADESVKLWDFGAMVNNPFSFLFFSFLFLVLTRHWWLDRWRRVEADVTYPEPDKTVVPTSLCFLPNDPKVTPTLIFIFICIIIFIIG